VADTGLQASVLKRAALIDAARKRDWANLADMLAHITDPKSEEVTAASLIRFDSAIQNQKVLAALLIAAKEPSPLVRAAAVQAMGLMPTAEGLQALVEATGDASAGEIGYVLRRRERRNF